jgi:WD40 repeat protein
MDVVKQAFAVALLWLPLATAAGACARAVTQQQPPPPVPLPHVGLPPAVTLPRPPTPLPPAPPPPELASLKPPPWLTLEAVYGTTHDIHHPAMTDAAFLDDGRTLVTLANDGELRVWDLVTRALRAQRQACAVKAPPDPFWHRALKLALSRDGLAAIGFIAGRVCVLELETDRHVNDIAAHNAHIVTLAFTGGELFSYGYQEERVAEAKIGPIVEQREAGGQARWWDARTGAQRGELTVGSQETVAISSDGAWLATGRTRFDWNAGKPAQAVGLWRRTGRARAPRPDAAEHVAVTRTGDVLYVTEDDGLRVWSEASASVTRFDTADGRPTPSHCVALALTDDGRFAATLMNDGTLLILWDVHARREINRRYIPGTPGAPRRQPALAFSGDGSMIATMGSGDAWVWATRDLSPLAPVESGALASGELQPDGRHLLTRQGKVASLLDITTGQPTWRCPTRDDAMVRLMPGGQRFLETHYEHTAVRDVATCNTVWETDHETWGPQTSLLISPDGRRIAVNDRTTGGPRMHAAVDGRVLWQGKLGNMLAFSHDARTLYVETRDWHVLALATADGALQATIDRERTSTNTLYPSPDDRRALVSNHQTTASYDLTTGQRLWQVKDSDYGFFFLPDNQTFVSDYTTIRLRSLATGLDVAPPFYPGPTSGGVRPIVLPDGKTLLLGFEPGLILRYRVDITAR